MAALIASMTGFGSSTREADGRRAQVEARSVNHRFLKVVLKLPPTVASLEPDLEALVRSEVRRGSVTLQVRYQETGDRGRFSLDGATLRTYVQGLTEIERELDVPELDCGTRLGLALGLPGVVKEQEDELQAPESLKALVLGAAREALQGLITARRSEGQRLSEQIGRHASNVAGLVAEAGRRAAVVPPEQRGKLLDRVQRLMQEVDGGASVSEQDLLREICLLADRLDVTEEIERLEGHLVAFKEALDAGEEVGRRLDFLLQEFNREANTIGSKANDAELSHVVVELKCEIERIREQVQNLE